METGVLHTGVFEMNEGVKRKRANEEMGELVESYPEEAKWDLGHEQKRQLKRKDCTCVQGHPAHSVAEIHAQQSSLVLPPLVIISSHLQ